MAKLTPAAKAKRVRQRKVKLAEELRLRSLTGSELNNRLFGSDVRPTQEGWEQRKLKRPPAALDEEMELLERKNKRTHFRDDLPPGFCPYYDVRCFLYDLVRHINTGLSMVEPERRDFAEHMLKHKRDLLRLAGQIRAIANLPATPLLYVSRVGDLFGQTVPFYHLKERRAEILALTKRILAAGEASERLAAICGEQRERLLPATNPGDVWFLSFVYWMGRYFRFLTGKTPGPDIGIFVNIVEHAHHLLGSPTELPLGSQIKTVRDRKYWNFEPDVFSRPRLVWGLFDFRRSPASAKS